LEPVTTAIQAFALAVALARMGPADATKPAPLPEDPAARAGELFGRAQALRRAGNCKAAIDVFEEFIAAGPPASDIHEAEAVIKDCREILGDEGEPEPPPPIPPRVDADPAPLPPARPQWWRDPAGGVLLGSGLAVAVTGAALYGVSFSRARDGVGESEMQFEDRRQSVRNFSAAGISLLAVGGALVLGAVIRYAVVSRAK
jgi:hypothetical protein